MLFITLLLNFYITYGDFNKLQFYYKIGYRVIEMRNKLDQKFFSDLNYNLILINFIKLV